MPALVRAGGEGLLSEDVFARVLQLNDALTATLEAEKNGTVFDLPKLETAAGGKQGGSSSSSSGGGGKISANRKVHNTGDLLSFGDDTPPSSSKGNGNGMGGAKGGGKVLSSARLIPGQKTGGKGRGGGGGGMGNMQGMHAELDLLGMDGSFSAAAIPPDTSVPSVGTHVEGVFDSTFHGSSSGSGGGGAMLPPPPGSMQVKMSALAPAPPAASEDEDFDAFINSLQAAPAPSTGASTASGASKASLGHLDPDL